MFPRSKCEYDCRFVVFTMFVIEKMVFSGTFGFFWSQTIGFDLILEVRRRGHLEFCSEHVSCPYTQNWLQPGIGRKCTIWSAGTHFDPLVVCAEPNGHSNSLRNFTRWRNRFIYVSYPSRYLRYFVIRVVNLESMLRSPLHEVKKNINHFRPCDATVNYKHKTTESALWKCIGLLLLPSLGIIQN